MRRFWATACHSPDKAIHGHSPAEATWRPSSIGQTVTTAIQCGNHFWQSLTSLAAQYQAAEVGNHRHCVQLYEVHRSIVVMCKHPLFLMAGRGPADLEQRAPSWQRDILAQNNARVRNVQNGRNMIGPRLFGTFGPNQSNSHQNRVVSAQITQSQHVEISGCQI